MVTASKGRAELSAALRALRDEVAGLTNPVIVEKANKILRHDAQRAHRDAEVAARGKGVRPRAYSPPQEITVKAFSQWVNKGSLPPAPDQLLGVVRVMYNERNGRAQSLSPELHDYWCGLYRAAKHSRPGTGTDDTGSAEPQPPPTAGQARPIPPEAFKPLAEVDAPPGIDNPDAPPPWFVGRTSELTRLDTALSGDGEQVVVAAVHGLGGVGKSSLVAQWIATWAHGTWPVVWIRADTAQNVEQGLAEFGTRLQPMLAEVLTVPDLAERGMQWLATHTGWLLVLDNVENPADIATLSARVRGKGRVVITGRLSFPWQPGATVLSLDVLSAEEAEHLLVGLATALGPRDLDGVAELCAALGYLPLAIEQAGAYLGQDRFTTIRGYLKKLTDQPGPTMDRSAVGADPKRTIARIWRVTLDRIADIDPAAVELLQVLAWYASDRIPITLCHNINNDDDSGVETDGAATLAVLAAYSLITPHLGSESLSIHRLVQTVARTPDTTDPHRRPEAIEHAHHRAIETLHTRLPDWQNPAAWPAWRALLPHIDALTSHTTAGKDSVTATLAAIRNLTGLFLNGQGLHVNALTHLQIAVTDRERVLGTDHPNTLASRNNLASAYESAGRVAEAIPLYERTLTDSERVLGEDHPNTLASRNNLASAYESAGRVAEAIPLYERTLTDSERVLGEDHPNTLASRNNLAGAYESAGRVAEAIPLHERTLTDSERVLGTDHPSTLTSRNNLALAYQSAGRVREAIPVYERTLTDSERVLGEDHPDTLASRNNLASAYKSAGRVAEAIPLYQRTLTDRERVLGEDHPSTLTSRNNLAGAYESAGRVAEAIPLYQRTLTDRERVLGEDHPDTLASRNNLASAYQSAGRVREAIPLHERTLTDSERVLGEDHPSTLTSRNNLALAYQSAGRVAEAIPLYQRTLTDRERVLGEDHPDTLASRNNLAGAYWSAGLVGKAIILYEQILAGRERNLGLEHSSTQALRDFLAVLQFWNG
ncbi:tetratricopeptide repeat protein (plasmid) [Nocardia sp. PE-7]|uniref:tetratricopeptide repeat protein n=1 Tax=Nocardia sp. PE-7 TaxID=3058426 RepID=UPI0026599AA4|nr:tetratricopeptide repeat protein [Nocardia sp. PE-7]WKG13603.1 tetratricopeptide repeat protein [Nocardia sp. PE-7]